MEEPPRDDPNGQINAYFRWAVVKDAPAEFAMDLRLVAPGELSAKSPSVPGSSTADVTLRRLQRFKIDPAGSCEWSFGTGEQARFGTAKPDAAGLLTVPRLTIRTQPARLTLKPAPAR